MKLTIQTDLDLHHEHTDIAAGTLEKDHVPSASGLYRLGQVAVVDSVLSVGECRALIAKAELAGFSIEGRCLIEDDTFTASLRQRLIPLLPHCQISSSRLELMRCRVGHVLANIPVDVLLLFLNGAADPVNDGCAPPHSAEFIGGSVCGVTPQPGRAVLFEDGRHDAKIDSVTRGVMYVLKVAAGLADCTDLAPLTVVTPGAMAPTALAALPGACYTSSLLDPPTAARLFAEAQALPFPRRNRGITREEGAPLVGVYPVGPCGTRDVGGSPLPTVLAEVIRLLLDCRLLRKMPIQASVNYYEQPRYCMVPHKDGYADQTCILSLGSDACLLFWHEPTTAEERLGRRLMHRRHSGTAVYSDCLQKPPHAAVWLEAGSVLTLEALALDDYVHGLPSSARDTVDLSLAATAATAPNRPPALANGHCIDRPAVRQRAGTLSANGETCVVPRQPRVSIVLWTEFVSPSPGLKA